MKISSFQLYSYSLPLIHEITIHEKKMQKREGIILQLTSTHGVSGFGEMAPLPGLSHETLAQAQQQITTLKNFFLTEEIPEHIEFLDGQCQKWLDHLGLFPSVQFAIEMAALNLLANSRPMPLNHLLSTTNHDQIRINGLLLQNSKENLVREAKKLLSEGFINIKLKVGGNIDEDIKKVLAINKALNGRAMLHLDANQSWNPGDAIKFGNKVGCAAAVYIEEPFKEINKVPEFFEETLIPVAFDETVAKIDLNEIAHIEGVDIIVLKPMILGGIEKTKQLMENAKKKAISTVVSSSFESAIGILTLAHLVGTSARDQFAGLDTLKCFERNLLKDELRIQHAKIDLRNRHIDAKAIRFDRLTEIQT